MSAHDYYQPHVYIDGRRLNELADIDGLTPIADLKIKWGANDWWSHVEPAEARLTLIDPRGELLNLAPGTSIMITADPDNRALFRGTMAASTARYRHITNSRGTRYEVWEVEVIAHDPLAGLAANRSHGPTYAVRNGVQDLLHWGRQSIEERFAELDLRCAAPVAYTLPAWCQSIDTAWLADTTQPAPMAPYTTQQNVSALTVLRQSARIFDWTARPYYDPILHQVRLISAPSLTSAIRRTIGFTDDFRPSIAHGSAFTLDAAELQPASGSIELALDPLEFVNHVALLKRRETLKPADLAAGYWGSHYEIEEVYGETTGVGGENGTTIELTYDLGGTSWTPASASQAAAAIMLNAKWGGFRAIPPLRYEPGKTQSTTVGHDRLFRAAPWPLANSQHPVYGLVNTPLAWSATMPMFSIVGGELTYQARRGWIVDATPAPVWTQSATGSTLGTLAAGADPINITSWAELEMFDPRITLADLQLI